MPRGFKSGLIAAADRGSVVRYGFAGHGSANGEGMARIERKE